MKINYFGQEFNTRLSDEIISNIEPDFWIEDRYFVFIPKQQLNRLHRFFAGEEVCFPNERESLLEFKKDYTEITLSVNGSGSDVYYREELPDIEFSQSEKKRINAAISKYALT